MKPECSLRCSEQPATYLSWARSIQSCSSSVFLNIRLNATPPLFCGSVFSLLFVLSRNVLLSSWETVTPRETNESTLRSSILILSCCLRLDIPRGLIPSAYPTKSAVCISLLPLGATCPAHLILFYLISWNSSSPCPYIIAVFFLLVTCF